MLAREDQAEPATPCAICAKPATASFWGHELCDSCGAAWFSDARFNAGEVDRALGLTWETPMAEAVAKAKTEFTKRTREWVRERKVRVA